VDPAHLQDGCAARFEWGMAGLRALAPHVAAVVIVDVLRFTTCVEVALSRGATVEPHPWDGTATHTSLSPAELLHAEAGSHLVMPSPNGSALSVAATELGAVVFAGCLRNATAVGRAAAALGDVAVIAAGERWPDGSLRPCLEDLLGAGAILAALDPAGASREAAAAMTAFAAAAGDLEAVLLDCASGRELVAKGFGHDIPIAAESDLSDVVPRVTEGVYLAV
jgi:2-phosphosulfolactate phosphatase